MNMVSMCTDCSSGLIWEMGFKAVFQSLIQAGLKTVTCSSVQCSNCSATESRRVMYVCVSLERALPLIFLSLNFRQEQETVYDVIPLVYL